jgi:hypothetical protein
MLLVISARLRVGAHVERRLPQRDSQIGTSPFGKAFAHRRQRCSRIRFAGDPAPLRFAAENQPCRYEAINHGAQQYRNECVLTNGLCDTVSFNVSRKAPRPRAMRTWIVKTIIRERLVLGHFSQPKIWFCQFIEGAFDAIRRIPARFASDNLESGCLRRRTESAGQEQRGAEGLSYYCRRTVACSAAACQEYMRVRPFRTNLEMSRKPGLIEVIMHFIATP